VLWRSALTAFSASAEHRINAETAAVREHREFKIEDGTLQTACQQSCPADAIVFGNINDPNSRVSKLKALNRNYGLLADLNTRPRTTYLAEIRNPNPELKRDQRRNGWRLPEIREETERRWQTI
jgi:Fe-S-cluster-containing dehydrogenase component